MRDDLERQSILIRNVAVAHPPYRVTQEAAVELLSRRLVGEQKRLAALARGSAIRERALIMPPEQLLEAGGAGMRSERYWIEARELAFRAAACALSEFAGELDCLATSTCTGYHLPGLSVELQSRLRLGERIRRIPLTDPGCAGGVAALMLAAEHLATRAGSSALAVSVEICSLSLQFSASAGNLTAALIFGDGAGAALLEHGPGRGLRIIDSGSFVIPGTQHLLGFELGDRGFEPILERELVDVLPGWLSKAATRIAEENCLTRGDIAAWLVHPGGARILRECTRALALSEASMRWSWQSLSEFGNTSSAAIFDVLRRYIEDGPRPGEFGLIVGFGPGVAIELLLVQAC